MCDRTLSWTITICFAKSPRRLNDLSQMSQETDSFECTVIWSFRRFGLLKLLPQYLQGYDGATLWSVNWCSFKYESRLQDFWQILQVNRFNSGKCVVRWSFKVGAVAKPLPHSVQIWGRNFSWTAILCLSKSLSDLNVFSQISQLNDLSIELFRVSKSSLHSFASRSTARRYSSCSLASSSVSGSFAKSSKKSWNSSEIFYMLNQLKTTRHFHKPLFLWRQLYFQSLNQLLQLHAYPLPLQNHSYHLDHHQRRHTSK